MSGSGSIGSTVRARLRRMRAWISGGGCSNQSISPFCRAAAEVEASVMICHSTRSKKACLGPAVRLGVPAVVGL